MTSADPVARLYSLDQFGIKLGLSNVRALCEAMGSPERAYRTVIIAGTNGKGSVTAMLGRTLTAAGYRTATYTSPHLIHLEERYRIDGQSADSALLREVLGTVLETADRCRASGVLAVLPTFFEIATVTGFELFRRAGVDVTVLEVGLGGRFDATNVTHPIAGAITSIALDHERYLGSTEASIAFEKAGVIKPGMPVVIGPLSHEADEVIQSVCRERDAPCVRALSGVESSVALGKDGTTCLTLSTPVRSYGDVRLALRGLHQTENAIVTVRLAELIDAGGFAIPGEAIVTGLSDAVWPGRLQLVPLPQGGAVLLDGAHNPAGARALARYLGQVYPERLPIVFGVMRDKDARAMLSELAGAASAFVFTQPSFPRGMPAQELLEVAHSMGVTLPCHVELDTRRAIAHALDRQGTVCVAGSLFLLGEVLENLTGPQ